MAEDRRFATTATGPEPPLADVSDAAQQLHPTGHSCIAQHFLGANDGSAKADIGETRLVSSPSNNEQPNIQINARDVSLTQGEHK